MGAYDELPSVFQKNLQNGQAESNRLADEAALVISDLARQYPEWAKADVDDMFVLLDRAIAAKGVARYRLVREEFFRKAHDIKGQGATFGYPLMTDLGAAICDYLRDRPIFNDEDLKLMRAYVEDMSFVLNHHLTGDGGEAAAGVRERLKRA